MIHDDEVSLFNALLYRDSLDLHGKFATEIAIELGITEKRALYILEKWSKRGIWNSGITLRSGWFEFHNVRDDSVEWLKELRAKKSV